MDNRIKLLEEILFFCMQGVEFDYALFPYTTLFRSLPVGRVGRVVIGDLVAGLLIAGRVDQRGDVPAGGQQDRKSTRLNSSHTVNSYAVFCLKKKKEILSFRMQGVEFDHGDMYVDGH